MVLWFLSCCVSISIVHLFSNTDTAGNTSLYYEIVIFAETINGGKIFSCCK